MKTQIVAVLTLMLVGCLTNNEPGDSLESPRELCDHNCTERGCLTGAQALQCSNACINESEAQIDGYNRCERSAADCDALQQCAQGELSVDAPENGVPNNVAQNANNLTTPTNNNNNNTIAPPTCNGLCDLNRDCADGEFCDDSLMERCCIAGPRGMLDTGDPCDSGNDCVAGLCIYVLPACSNSRDDDMDGATDFPADPGCSSAEDNDEVEGSTASPFLCSNPCEFSAECPIDFDCLMESCHPI